MSEWIANKKPECGQMVLVNCRLRGVRYARYSNVEGFIDYDVIYNPIFGRKLKVTHWMPLPKPPEGK